MPDRTVGYPDWIAVSRPPDIIYRCPRTRSIYPGFIEPACARCDRWSRFCNCPSPSLYFAVAGEFQEICTESGDIHPGMWEIGKYIEQGRTKTPPRKFSEMRGQMNLIHFETISKTPKSKILKFSLTKILMLY